ncbi:hypothetical protein IQ07DRAFT_321321 [Pyrenochaeta sp. DS3sAY3a]|nr:hypothetical protein IQ07DRAFT_321321 [Pyrenochaeta sp. DS3sAY3a]
MFSEDYEQTLYGVVQQMERSGMLCLVQQCSTTKSLPGICAADPLFSGVEIYMRSSHRSRTGEERHGSCACNRVDRLRSHQDWRTGPAEQGIDMPAAHQASCIFDFRCEWSRLDGWLLFTGPKESPTSEVGCSRTHCRSSFPQFGEHESRRNMI